MSKKYYSLDMYFGSVTLWTRFLRLVILYKILIKRFVLFV